MEKQTSYTRAEIDYVLNHIAREASPSIDTGEGSAIRNLAGESERDYNITLLFGILLRMGVCDRRDMADWVDGVGYTRTTRLHITEKHLREITPGRVKADGQIAIL